jgi:tetratricopeptide (TPR) repeat protein
MAQAGRTQEALADYLWLSQQADCTASDWFNLGYLLEQTKQHEHAAEAFKQSVSLDPDLDRAWFGLGLTLHHQGNLDDALRALTRNTELQPMSPHGWVQLARIHGQRQETDEVLKIIRHLKGFEPKVAAELMRETGIGLTSGRT